MVGCSRPVRAGAQVLEEQLGRRGDAVARMCARVSCSADGRNAVAARSIACCEPGAAPYAQRWMCKLQADGGMCEGGGDARRCWRSSWGGAATRWRRYGRCCCARWPTCRSASPSARRPSSRRARGVSYFLPPHKHAHRRICSDALLAWRWRLLRAVVRLDCWPIVGNVRFTLGQLWAMPGGFLPQSIPLILVCNTTCVRS